MLNQEIFKDKICSAYTLARAKHAQTFEELGISTHYSWQHHRIPERDAVLIEFNSSTIVVAKLFFAYDVSLTVRTTLTVPGRPQKEKTLQLSDIGALRIEAMFDEAMSEIAKAR